MTATVAQATRFEQDLARGAMLSPMVRSGSREIDRALRWAPLTVLVVAACDAGATRQAGLDSGVGGGSDIASHQAGHSSGSGSGGSSRDGADSGASGSGSSHGSGDSGSGGTKSSGDAGGTDATAGSSGGPDAGGAPTSCNGHADGTTIQGGQMCCVGHPIAPTSNSQCPALFHGSALGSASGAVVGGAASPTGRGYWLVSKNGGVFSYGDAMFYGSAGGENASNIVGMAVDPAATGYWLVGSDGGVFSYGSAAFGGSLPGNHVTVSNIVGIVANPAGSGYWLVGSDGNVYALGGAVSLGTLPAMNVTVTNIVGMAATPGGGGYWLAGADGGIFSFGNAAFAGSLPGMNVTATNIVGVAANPEGDGYWLVGSDGGIFTFGTGNYFASNALTYTSSPVTAMFPSPHVYGYWMTASDGEVFVAPNAPPESTATPPIGSSESYLGATGSFDITLWDANGQRNCNEGPFGQIPGDPVHVIGRYNNGCTSQNGTVGPSWSLARWSVDWSTYHVTFDNMIFDTSPGSVAISGGNSLNTYYDATIVSYAGELWVAGECGGTIAGAGTASACIGPLSTTTWTMNPARTNVAILGNDSLGNGYVYSASVPKLLVLQNNLYLYWSAVDIQASSGTWQAITERGTQLAELPATSGLLWAARTGSAVGSRDPNYTVEVWGLGTATSDNATADIGGIFTDGVSVFANGSIAGTACGTPFWPPTCYSLAFAKSANPLGNDIFNSGTVLPVAYLPTNAGGEIRLFTDSSGKNYLWGSYFTNTPGTRPLPLTGAANAGYWVGFPVPSGTPFFESL